MNDSAGSERVATFQAKGTIDANGRLVVEHPSDFQGHFVGLTFKGHTRQPSNSFRVRVEICSPFRVFEDGVEPNAFEGGWSNLRVPENMIGRSVMSGDFVFADGRVVKCSIQFQADGSRRLQRIDVLLSADSIDVAANIGTTVAGGLLNSLSYRHQVPVAVRQVDVLDERDGRQLARFQTIPFSDLKEITVADLNALVELPPRLRPVLSLYREALASTDPASRFLSLYRASEALEKVKAENNARLRGAERSITRPKRRVPSHELAKTMFPNLAGKPVKDLLDHVYKEFRLDTAHGNIDEFGNVKTDPMSLATRGLLDTTNSILFELVREAIDDEHDRMKLNSDLLGRKARPATPSP